MGTRLNPDWDLCVSHKKKTGLYDGSTTPFFWGILDQFEQVLKSGTVTFQVTPTLAEKTQHVGYQISTAFQSEARGHLGPVLEGQ
jgi:hypothetical protein